MQFALDFAVGMYHVLKIQHVIEPVVANSHQSTESSSGERSPPTVERYDPDPSIYRCAGYVLKVMWGLVGFDGDSKAAEDRKFVCDLEDSFMDR